MKRKLLLISTAVALCIAGIAVFVATSEGKKAEVSAASDPRNKAFLVKISTVAKVANVDHAFTGTVAARVQSNLGFRVPGKVVERLVDVGQQVKLGQPLIRIDETDLRLALTAKRNAVAAAKAVLTQASADEKRYAVLAQGGLAAAPQRYEQAKAAMDTAQAQLDAAEADAKVAENQATYSTIVADADGTVVATLAEPGQVVAAGQPVIQLAKAGPREALIALPETLRPAIGSVVEASVYGRDGRKFPAQLRQLSDTADGDTRTYEARYVLGGDAANSPLGATVIVRFADSQSQTDVSVPIGSLIDDGNRTGVWAVDQSSSTIHFVPVMIKRLDVETAVVSGVRLGEPIVALGAHLLREGDAVRTSIQAEASRS